jgi:hypothetical protein
LYYSREAAGNGANTRSFFRVTLRTISIFDPGTGTQMIFNKSGPDLQKYVSKIEYSEGTSSFTSIDWNSNLLVPTMKIELTTASTGPANPAGGMGR